MDSVRTSSLFHYTDYQSLLKIIREGLIPNYCREELVYEKDISNSKELTLGIPMVSFCDIPISRIGELAGRYGNFAIGLKKSWAEGRAINPVSYVKDDRVLQAYYSALEMQRIAQNKINDMAKKNDMLIFKQLHQQSINPQELILPFFTSKILKEKKDKVTRDIGFLLGFAKRYIGYRNDSDREKHKLQNNYVENEWRYIVQECPQSKWFWSKEEYYQWRGTKDKPKPTEYFVEQKLKFTIDDISFIIVKTEKQVTYFVNLFSNINEVGGYKMDEFIKDCITKTKIPKKQLENEKKQLENLRRQLASKIISLESIKNNF